MGFPVVGGAGLIVVAVQNVHAQSVILTFVLILLAILFIVVGLLVFARLPLILVMVALQRYAGILACWRLSRGIGLRTVGILVLATLPFTIGVWVTGAILGIAANSLWCLLPAIACVLFEFLERAASFGAIALIYKFQMDSLQPRQTESPVSG
jgi:hypothetical protein